MKIIFRILIGWTQNNIAEMKIKLEKKLYRRYADFQSPKSLSSFYTKIFYVL